ncbi:IQ motif and ubiquitin-like domain-containing protein [Onthophagus taurus]|uniref:IQ motif and ubiquitin-like domain-containing protein n=1 Tax=Onthophagus taurus TaxID=166361 RepID=UPI000C209B36|nr:IQ and ubiquitin-like domain-containing protein [Onthophagus taurus]
MTTTPVPSVKSTKNSVVHSTMNTEESSYNSILACFDRLLPEDTEARSITVKFRSHGEFIYTQSYYEGVTIGYLKDVLTDILNIPSYAMELIHEDRYTDNNEQLCNFDIGIFRILELDLFSTHVFSTSNLYEDYFYPDVLTVQIMNEDGTWRYVVVEIEHKEIIKPFLGGYLNILTGVEYHHGYTQTGPLPPRIPVDQQSNRDTQTYFLRNRKQLTTYSRATQMANEEIWIPNVTDKILKAGKYITAEELEKIKNIPGKVKIIQRYYRAWKIRRSLKELAKEYYKRLEKEAEEDEYQRRIDDERKKQELIAKVFPRSKSDFSMIYYMLDKWKKAELERITSNTCGPARLAEMYLLLEKEIEFLRNLDMHRQAVAEDEKIQKTETFFETIGKPIQWNSEYKNLLCTMDSLETQKAREYYKIYLQLTDKNKTKEERIQILLGIKLSLDNHTCEISAELIDLIDRECTLTVRGLNEHHLEILQKRIESLFVKHIQQPECSNGVTNRMNRVREKLMEGNLFFCHRCKKLKTHEEFPLNSRTESFIVCKSCSYTDRVLEPWFDIAPYRFILRWIRREERLKCSSSSVAFIMQERDIEYIINRIWHSHSAVNECNDIYELRLCRFFKEEDWAPWNCILLTKDEVKQHLNIRTLDKVYDNELLCNVYNKHVLAKKYFAKALQLDNYYQEIGKVDTRWNEIIELKQLVKVTSKPKIFLSCH